MRRHTQCSILLLSLLLLANSNLYAQGYVDQNKVEPIITAQAIDSIKTMHKVHWHTYTYTDHDKNDSLSTWEELMKHVDSLPGHFTGLRQYIIELANRKTHKYFKDSSILVIPDSFAADYRAYSPYPFHYPAADTLVKLFIIDKYTQTFGAYENGWLVHWGILSTGSTNRKTPVGRYNFNWKDEFRLSNAAPPGERWELHYLFNFHVNWGIHVHQYSLPIGKAVSHGCVRVAMADAIWNYNWAHTWKYKQDTMVRNGTPVMVINNNPKNNRARHWEITTTKDTKETSTAITSLVRLPDNPATIPLGTYVQKLAPWNSGW